MGSSPGLKPPRSGCITTCWQSRSPTSLPVHRKRLRDRLRHVRGPAGRRTRVKTHKSQKSLRPSRFRLPESLEGIRKERVGSTSYAFMSLDPNPRRRRVSLLAPGTTHHTRGPSCWLTTSFVAKSRSLPRPARLPISWQRPRLVRFLLSLPPAAIQCSSDWSRV